MVLRPSLLGWRVGGVDRPLTGKRVMITRAPEQAGELAVVLAERGAELFFYPLLRIEGPVDPGPLDAALGGLAGYDLVVFTSRNGVDRTCERAWALGVAWAAWPAVAAIGAGTQRAAEAQRLRVAVRPERADADGLVAAIAAAREPGRALLPQAHNARPRVRDGLVAAGWSVDAVEAYRGLDAAPGALPEHGTIDAVVFASAATVERFHRLAGVEAWTRLRTDGCALVAIGEQTAEAIRAFDGFVAAVAAEPTIEALGDAVVLALIG